MSSNTEMNLPCPADRAESEAFPDLISAADRLFASGDALEAYRAFDDGVLAEVPHALEAYMSQQRLCLN